MPQEGAQPVGSAPVFVVRDLAASIDYYRDRLGFEVAFRFGEPVYYAGICRGAVTIHLLAAAGSSRPPGASSLYVFVASADAIHAELVERGARVLQQPETYPYGMRDFNVEDLDGNQLTFGNEIEAQR
jgi:catechol 2,3-dioxygenase-like lactoylglutathione lyase family enzyme